ncbi:MAG: cytidine deaminase [Candidatus Sericytochromatia bacterium]|nr:cytidine deaminase [Candidatus Sericytochromatia bacterium]
MSISPELQRALLAAAHEAAAASYSPYSNFPVGAALYLGDDAPLVLGCNVENASFSMTLCAERTAIVKAVSDGHRANMRAIAIVATKTRPCFPCGACLQVMREFAPEILLIFEDAQGDPVVHALSEMLPFSFSNQDLPQ